MIDQKTKATLAAKSKVPINARSLAMLRMGYEGDFNIKSVISYRAVHSGEYDALAICLSVVDSLGLSALSKTFREVILVAWKTEPNLDILPRIGRVSIPSFSVQAGGSCDEQRAKIGYVAMLLTLMKYGPKLDCWADNQSVIDFLNSIAKQSDWADPT